MDDVLKLRDYLYEKAGLYLPDGRRYIFEGQFLKCMEALGIATMSQYYSFLTSNQNQKSAIGQLVNEIAGNETSFFGDEVRFRALQDIFLPEIVSRKSALGERRLRIWSAGCSSGEEAYAVAMVLHSLKDSLLKDWDGKVWATDMSTPILEKAKTGLYQEFALHGIPAEYREAYLQSQGSGLRVSEVLKRYVDFQYHDLETSIMEANIASSFDIVYCSNVLVRFDVHTRGRIIQNFYDALCEGGYLLLGYYESLNGLNNGFYHIHFTGGMGYRKLTDI